MPNLSKSKYTRYCQCPKMLWMDTYKKELAQIDESVQKRFEEGSAVGELAKGLLGYYVDVSAITEDGGLDIGKMLRDTRRHINIGTENICEAAFSIDGCYCAVDILHKVNNGYEIYEVKSSTSVSDVYLIDISYQKYVLEKAGLNIVGTYIVHINNKYVRSDDIDIHSLFKIVDVSGDIWDYYSQVSSMIKQAKLYISQKDEPCMDIGEQCNSPYACAYFKYCSQFLPEPSVFDLYRISFKKACELVDNGIMSYGDVITKGVDITTKQRTQIEHALLDLPTYVDKLGVRSFLNGLKYPLYFLDFETFNSCIPLYDGQKPFQQVPFQYSLHIVHEDMSIEHREFLGDENVNPCRAIAESLVRDIPMDVCSIAYNMSFEQSRLKELADQFPDLSEHLMNIRANMQDLLLVFREGFVYNKAMGGSFSIKKVLPAMFPNNPHLYYHNLNDVHNGSEATTTYLALRTMNAQDREQFRQSLLAYCKLDTFAMVMLWQRLKELSI